MSALHIVAFLGGVVGMLTAIISSTACFYHLHTTSKNSLSILERKVKDLNDLLENIQQKLNEKGVLRPDPSKWVQELSEKGVPWPDLLKWISNARTLIDRNNEMDLGVRLHESCANECLPNLCGLCGAWKLIERNVGEINKLLLEGKEFKIIGYKKCIEKKNIFGIGFEKMREMIWKEVSRGGVQVVCVHGMAGVGKTLMASAIHDLALEKMEELENVIWVSIKHKSTIKYIQEEIARQLHVEILDYKDDKSRAKTLKGALSKKKFFMVLDNLPMRQDFHLGDIGIPSSGNNWKLLVASRSHSACTKVRGGFSGRSRIYEMQPLSEQEAWELFVDVARPNNVHLKGDICEDTMRAVYDLDGLPAGVKMLAKALKQIPDDHPDRINGAWHRELVALSSSGSLLGSRSEEFFCRIRYSFEDLSEVALSCLLYSLLFPKDYVIKAKELIEYWMWEGLLGEEVSSLEETMGMGWEVLSKLIDVHLLKKIDKEEGQHDEESVMMLNTIRLVAMDVAKSSDHKFLVNCGKSLKELPAAKDWPENAVRASFVENEVCALQNGPDCKELSTLLLQKNHLNLKPQKKFFSKLMNLRVLDLSYTGITFLPKSLFGLKELRALLLRDCYNLTSLRSLSDLQNLLVIDLSGTPLGKLPHGLRDLTNIRRLDLSRTNLEVFRAEEVSRLTQIEELLLISNQEEGKLTWGSNEIYPVWKGPCIEEFVGLGKLVVLQLNFLDTAVFIRFLDTSKIAQSGQRCKFCVGGYYNNVGRVVGDNSLTMMHDHLVVTLPSLGKYGCFNELTTLDVSYFDKLEYVLTWETFNSLKKLRDVHVKLCRNLVSIIQPHEEGEAADDIVSVSALTTLVLYDLPKLKSICDCRVLNCTSMQEVEVWNCGILELPRKLNGGKHGVVIKGERNWLDKVKRYHSSNSTNSTTFRFSEISLPIELSQSAGCRSDIVTPQSPEHRVPSPEPPNGPRGITTFVTSLAGFICDPIINMYGSISSRFADTHRFDPSSTTEDVELGNHTLRRSNSQ